MVGPNVRVHKRHGRCHLLRVQTSPCAVGRQRHAEAADAHGCRCVTSDAETHNQPTSSICGCLKGPCHAESQWVSGVQLPRCCQCGRDVDAVMDVGGQGPRGWDNLSHAAAASRGVKCPRRGVGHAGGLHSQRDVAHLVSARVGAVSLLGKRPAGYKRRKWVVSIISKLRLRFA